MRNDLPHYLGHRKRLRERFLKAGFAGFADHEIVELLLTLAIPRGDVKGPAKELLQRFENLRGILDAPLDDLRETRGIGEVVPIVLRIIREAATLYLQQKGEAGQPMSDPQVLSKFWRLRLGDLRDEVFEVAYLDTAARLLRDGIERLGAGTIDRATVYPRKVMEAALRRGAAALVFAHNHPNRDVTPSEQDKLITEALVLAATTLNIQVLDHLIVSSDKVFSFRREGLL
jgi:DNA repair protein RadC